MGEIGSLDNRRVHEQQLRAIVKMYLSWNFMAAGVELPSARSPLRKFIGCSCKLWIYICTVLRQFIWA